MALRGGLRLISFWLILSTATVATANPAAVDSADLAELMPPDTLVYVGWWGAGALGTAGSDSRSGPALADVFEAVAGADKGTVTELRQARQLGEMVEILWRSPAALALLDLGMGEEGPDIQAALMVAAGDSAPRLHALFTELVRDLNLQSGAETTVAGVRFATADVPRLPMPLCWGVHEGRFLLTLGTSAAAKLIGGIATGGPRLAGSTEMRACRAAVAGHDDRPAFCIYVDVAGTVSKGKALAQAVIGGETLPPIVEAVLEEAGINGIRSKYLQLSMEGGTTRLGAYVHAPRPRKGILQLWEQAPLSDADFAFVPADARFMCAYNWDMAASYRLLSETLGRISPGLAGLVGNLMNVAFGFLGVHPIDDVLGCFGDTWVWYDAPAHGGMLFSGTVLVVEMRDADRLQRSIEKVVGRVDAMAGKRLTLTTKQVTCSGREMAQLCVGGVPFPVAPAWGVVGDRWVLGLYPQTVAAAMDEIDAGTRRSSLLENREFKLARGRLPAGAQAICYLDNKYLTQMMYPFALMVAQMATSMAGETGLVLDVAAMPTLPELQARTPNSVGVSVADDEGILYVETAPGAGPLALVSAVACTMDVAVPALKEARKEAKRSRSRTNLRMIGQVGKIYANDQGDEAWPPDLQTMLEGLGLRPEQLRSPSDESGDVSYVYIGGQTEHDDARNIIAYEKPELNDYEGTNALFLDAHVEFMRMEEFEKALRDTYERLGRESEMPSFPR